MTHPLSPITYCRRNLPRIVPMSFVIVLSVFLVATVVTIVNSVDLTVTTVYNYTRVMTPIVPQRDSLSVDDADRAIAAREPGVDRVIDSQGMFMNINTVFGQVPFVLIAVPPDQRDYLIRRGGDRLVSGRMPIPGRPEAVLSIGLVRNRKFKLGDVVAAPDDQGGLAGSPIPVHLVGILDGPTWIAFTTPQFVDIAAPLMPKFLIVTSKDPAKLGALSTRLEKDENQVRVQIVSYHYLVNQLRTSLASMYLLMSLVNAMVIMVVAMMSGMLSNIYFTQRITEFAILSAIGLRRGLLLWHAVSETAIVTGLGWVIGVFFTWGMMSFLRGSLFEPRGMLIDPRDPIAFLYTIPIPLMITLFAIVTVSVRLSRLDPVSIIERR
jgi:ABC-type antimicrobial peptide transport system permease subunit